MKLLAFDTATDACSCAVYADGEIYARHEIAPRRHAELILPMADALLTGLGIKREDLNAVAFGQGPGSFTGIRIACGIAQGIALGLGIPAVPVSCLAALAQGAYRRTGAEAVLAAIDARMQEVYWGVYQISSTGLMQLDSTPECVSPPDNVPLPAGGAWFGSGSGWLSYAEPLRQRTAGLLTGYEGEAYPLAEDIVHLGVEAFRQGHVVNPEQALPVYLRDRVTG